MTSISWKIQSMVQEKIWEDCEAINEQIEAAHPEMARYVEVKGRAFPFGRTDSTFDPYCVFRIENPSFGSMCPEQAVEYAEALIFASGLIDAQVAIYRHALDAGVPLEDIFA